MFSRVLVADSDKSLADLYALCLRRQGYDVHFAHNGVECWARLQEVRPAALLLEWELPWGGGDGVVSRLREDWPWPEPLVVLTTTAELSPDDFERANLPVNSCLRKPFRLAELESVLRGACRGPAVLAPGQTVRVVRGPLAGVAGQVLRAPRSGRCLVKLQTGTQGVYCEISSFCLEPAGCNGSDPVDFNGD